MSQMQQICHEAMLIDQACRLTRVEFSRLLGRDFTIGELRSAISRRTECEARALRIQDAMTAARQTQLRRERRKEFTSFRACP